MVTKQLSGLRKKDFAKLLGVPDSDVMGEIIRLNCTAYSNGLDVIRVCSLIKEHRTERKGI